MDHAAGVNGSYPVRDLLPLREAVEEPGAELWAQPPGWRAQALRESGRYTIWAVPGQALLIGLVTLHRHPSTPLVLGAGLLGLLALAAVAGLLAGTRWQRLTLAGLVVGCAGTVMLLWAAGTAASTRRPGAVLLLGAGLLMLAWLLNGVAVTGCRALNRGDGYLLMIAAPMLYLGGLFGGPALHMLPTLGAMLLLAAGIGLVGTTARLACAGRSE
jgi:Amt family ammonium transporter